MDEVGPDAPAAASRMAVGSRGLAGGIDLGGTKIEARLFQGAGLATARVRRVPTPPGFDALVAALAEQGAWLCHEAGDPALPLGLALPGLVDPSAGTTQAANLPGGGGPVGDALAAMMGRPVPILNDAAAFALSEADGAAGTVVGLIIGTGLGAGVASPDGPAGWTARPLEIGHAGMPARALARHGLPLLRCGCGREGCVERYLSGTGIAALAAHVLGEPLTGEVLATGDPDAGRVLAAWSDLAGDALASVLLLHPGALVLGGGLSKLPGLVGLLTDGLRRHALPGAPVPEIRLARHGDSSGARGAALLALGHAAC